MLKFNFFCIDKLSNPFAIWCYGVSCLFQCCIYCCFLDMLKIINIFVKVEILKFVNMNVKLRVLSAGVLFFIGHSAMAQKVKKDSASTKEIEEVVVIGYGKQKKNEVTSSISTIKGSAMENLNTPSFENQLAGRSSGVQVVANSGIVGSAPTVRVRGVNSITGGTSPLYVVDGIPVISGDIGVGYVGANALGDINPNDIESISVLKDGAATAIYGSRAANGVILITTKKVKVEGLLYLIIIYLV